MTANERPAPTRRRLCSGGDRIDRGRDGPMAERRVGWRGTAPPEEPGIARRTSVRS